MHPCETHGGSIRMLHLALPCTYLPIWRYDRLSPLTAARYFLCFGQAINVTQQVSSSVMQVVRTHEDTCCVQWSHFHINMPYHSSGPGSQLSPQCKIHRDWPSDLLRPPHVLLIYIHHFMWGIIMTAMHLKKLPKLIQELCVDGFL